MIPFAYVITSLTLGAAFGQEPVIGKCPDVQVQKNFQPERYFGEWYEITKFYSSFESGQRCATAYYSPRDDGHFTVFNLALDSEDHEKNITGDAYSPDPNEKAKIKIQFEKVPSKVDYWVLDTDYDNYTLVYSCIDILNIRHLDFSWILSRKPTLEPEIRQRLYNLVESYGINSKNYKDEDRNNCWGEPEVKNHTGCNRKVFEDKDMNIGMQMSPPIYY